MDLSLHNKTALICGSSQGIGYAAAFELAGLGANCILFARNEESLKAAVAKLPTPVGQKHRYAIADFEDLSAVKSTTADLVAHQTIHILINNSGGPKAGLIEAAAAEAFQSAFNLHVINNQTLVNAVLPGMRAENYGRVINIISTSIKTPLSNLGVSNTIRAAVAGWSKTLANEIGAFNITVNNVLPGLTETARLTSLIEGTAGKEEKTVAEVTGQLLNSIPLKRFGQASEIANVIAFLASPAAAYVHGVSIPVDGGRTPSLT